MAMWFDPETMAARAKWRAANSNKPSEYKAGKWPGMYLQQTEAYLAAHPYPAIETTPRRYRATKSWLRSNLPGIGPHIKKHPLYYPDGKTLRLSKI